MAEPGPFAGRSVLVCGTGVAGASAVRALLATGARVLLTADRDSDAVAPLTEAGARWCGALAAVPDGVGAVVASPGLRPSHPLLSDAAARGIDVLGELELAWRLRPAAAAPWLALTGTNGKTTTAHMLEAILRAGGLRAAAVGNIGVPVIDAVLAWPPYDVLAVEMSSQQLHFAPSVRPVAGALLNIAADHLDWHGDMAGYIAAKARVFRAGIAIGNLDDERVAALLAGAPAARRVGFGLGEPEPGQLGVSGAELVDHAFGDGPVVLLPSADVRPSGAHNVANALAAAALARAHGVTAEAVAAGLRAFVPDPHRNQPAGEHAGVAYVDDSKATNPHAARASLLAYPRVVWIAGGQLKGAPVDELVAEIAPRLAGAVLLGADRAAIAEALRRHAPDVPVIDVSRTDDGVMTEVVRTAAGLARPGDTVLLAPAAASYDMFTSYAARGDAFAAAVKELNGPNAA